MSLNLLRFDKMTMNGHYWALDLLNFLYACHKISSTILFFSTIYFYYRLFSIKLIHFNLRLLIGNVGGCTALLSVTRQILHVILENTSELKDRFYVNVGCVALSLVNFAVQMGITTSFLMVAIERHFATVWVNTYEKSHGKFGLLLTLVAVSFISL